LLWCLWIQSRSYRICLLERTPLTIVQYRVSYASHTMVLCLYFWVRERAAYLFEVLCSFSQPLNPLLYSISLWRKPFMCGREAVNQINWKGLGVIYCFSVCHNTPVPESELFYNWRLVHLDVEPLQYSWLDFDLVKTAAALWRGVLPIRRAGLSRNMSHPLSVLNDIYICVLSCSVFQFIFQNTSLVMSSTTSPWTRLCSLLLRSQFLQF
jgi:hypothetical protein